MSDAIALAAAQLDKAALAGRCERARQETDVAMGWFVRLVHQKASAMVLAHQREKVANCVRRQLDLIVEGAALDRRVERAQTDE